MTREELHSRRSTRSASPRSGSRPPPTRCGSTTTGCSAPRRGRGGRRSRSRSRPGSCPTLERDAAGLVEALRGRGARVEGMRARARLLSPLLAGSLERGLNLAEAMEARGFGRAGRTRAPAPPWTRAGPARARGRRRSSRGSAVALARVERRHVLLSGRGAPALDGVSLSSSRASSSRCSARPARASRRCCARWPALVPHFHGGRFSGRVEVGGPRHADDAAGRARRHRRDALPGARGSGRAHRACSPRSRSGSRTSARRRRRSCRARARRSPRSAPSTSRSGASRSSRAASSSASASRRRSRSSRELLLLDEPSSQLDRDAAEALFEHARAHGCAVVVAEQRPELPLAFADRVVFLRDGRVADEAAARRGPSRLRPSDEVVTGRGGGRSARARLVRVCGRAAGARRGVARPRRGEVVALVGPNGVGKTTLAKLAAGLLDAGRRSRRPLRPRRVPARRIPAATSCRDRARRGRARGRRERARRALARLDLDGVRGARTRATSRAASASGSRSRRCSRSSPTCSCSTSRRAASTPSGSA